MSRETSVKLDLIENDRGPVGLRTYPASSFPRRMATTSVPIKWPLIGSVTLPTPMTSQEWDLFLDYVALMRESYVPAVPS